MEDKAQREGIVSSKIFKPIQSVLVILGIGIWRFPISSAKIVYFALDILCSCIRGVKSANLNSQSY